MVSKKKNKRQPARERRADRAVTGKEARGYELYVTNMLDQKDIAEMLRVTERTVSSWVNKTRNGVEAAWKKERALRQATPTELESDILEILAALAKQRKGTADAKERIVISQEVMAWNKALENMRRNNKPSLTTVTQILREFLDHCNFTSPKLVGQMVDLQKSFLQKKAPEYL